MLYFKNNVSLLRNAKNTIIFIKLIFMELKLFSDKLCLAKELIFVSPVKINY